VVLKPRRGAASYVYDPIVKTLSVRPLDEEMEREAITYYQTASYLYRQGRYRERTMREFADYTRQGEALTDQRTTASR
jgi:hypothetical protein